MTIAQLVINTLNCYNQNQQTPKCNNENYKYVSMQASIEYFFRVILSYMSMRSTKEDMFKYLKNELLEPGNHVSELTGSFGYEEILITKLNYKQK